MEQIQEIIRERAMQYAEEAFAEYKEETCAAFGCILACRNEARQHGLLALEELAESWKEKEGIPLKGLLTGMVLELIDSPDIDCWEEKACRRILEGGYSGYEWYIASLYAAGCKKMYTGVSETQYYLFCRSMVPERWQEVFDDDWESRTKEEQERNDARTEDWARYVFQREAAIRAAFHRRFEEMEPEGLRRILKELPDKILAAALAGAGESLRNRFLEQMSAEQKKDIVAEWYRNRDDEYSLRDIEKAMEQMTMAAGLMGGGQCS
ncbi:MAG: hypothetical protein K2N46_09735 [Lachnospiraceae bacterium]|nr:hypothetical protein [Lachnospiraceae bacterium]